MKSRFLFALLAVLATAVLPTALATPALAQAQAQQEGPDYAQWNKVASRVEKVLAEGKASTAAFDTLRGELVDWRTRFLDAQNINSARIKTLRDQISALGDPPAEGETEPQEIAKRRAELTKQLNEAQAPSLKAVEAYSRADGLIREIDQIIRERQADQLLQLGPSPVNPVNWAAGLTAIRGTLVEVGNELSSNWENPNARATMRSALPVTLLFLALAALLTVRGRRWMEMLSVFLAQRGRGRGRTLFSGIASLGQIVVPTLGVVLLAGALKSSAMLGLRTERLAQILPILGFTIFTAGWLGGRVFAQLGVSRAILTLPPERRAEGRFNSWIIGLILALAMLAQEVSKVETYSAEAVAVLSFPILLLAGLMLSRMGQLLLAHSRADSAESPEERPYRNRVAAFFGRAAIGAGLIGPLLAAVGYAEAGDFFVYPSILTLALMGFLLLLQRFVTDIYAVLMGRDVEDPENGGDLIPVLIGMMLVLLSLPVLALIWGARIADLTELWTRFTAGYSIGGTRISPTSFLTFVVVFTLGYALTRLVQGMLRSTVLPKTKIDPGGQTALISGVGYVGIFLAGVVSVTTAGIDLSSLAIVAGALSVGIGFGLQTIVQNFVSGIILLIERPVSQGDWIEVGGVMGIVKDISVRSTRIQTFDRTDVIVPNADLIAGQVTNWTRQNLTGRVILKVGVAYGSDTRKVEKILMEIGESHPLVMVNPAPLVVFQGFGADALEFELRVILRDINYGLSVRTELNHEIARRFAEEGIEIPFAQRDIWLRNPETLRERPAPQPPGPFLPRQTAEPQPEPLADLGGDADADGGDGPR
ncbi:DUF3772 domain-containing protein [Rhodovulum visakhapatnamense]|uniref:Mechanosensitive ion channel family protein n=1 Tax=Rhodovulum visakhapatnamense TaxID=364297 RepID=A0ABS1RKT9_9RHOB|nr:DUF3772 domain-containing protein [Rhodovulum visakhapatnamense]MBL3570399.1 mechanosensitive ion channel family protein [Rhodovulum visakhapatnamense]MBL3580284.1 mechanosensitive ion channel family protein [Rhodovulum visakhapatnamense]